MSAPSLAGLAAALWLGCLLPGPWWLAVVGAGALALAWGAARRRRRAGWAVALLALALVGAGLAGGRLAIADRGEVSALAETLAVADIEATVVTEPRPAAQGAWAVVRVTAVDGADARQRALLEFDEGQDTPPLGARIALSASAWPLEEDGFHGHLRRLGAVASLSARGPPEVVAPPHGALAASTDMRERAREAFGTRLDGERAALLTGLTTGDVRGRPDGQRERFAAAGLSHLVVVSGKHTALMLAGVLGICAVAGVGARGRRVAGLAALAWFVVLVRWQPSVLRAGGMAALVLVAGLLGRARVSGRLLWMAVILLLLAQPLLAGRLGFALSVLATAGVVVAGPRLVERLRGPLWLRWTAAATVGAQLGVAPVLMATDGGVPPGALPANLVAGPAAAVAQALGLAAGVVAQVSTPAAGALAWLAAPLLSVILWCSDAFGSWPAIGWRQLASPAALLTALAAGLWALGRRRRLAALVAVVALAAALAPPLRGPGDVNALSVTALDVGQGDALLVEAPSPEGTARLLYDGGSEPEQVLRLLRQRRIPRLDVVVLSHGHLDHAGGLPAVLESVDVDALVLGAQPDPTVEPPGFAADVVDAAGRAGVPVVAVAEGDRFALGAAAVSVLSPPAGRELAAGDLNENSVVLRADGAHGSVLLTGDAEEEAQRRLLERPGRIEADVLQVPHHGGATNAEGFLRSTGAETAVISVGADNDHGHPHPATLADVAGMTVWRTDLHGSVSVTLGPSGPTVTRRRTARARGPPRAPGPPRPAAFSPPALRAVRARRRALDMPVGREEVGLYAGAGPASREPPRRSRLAARLDLPKEGLMAAQTFDTLEGRVRGGVLTSAQEGYDTARRVYNAMHDRRPAVIVEAADVADVVATVGEARESGLDLAVRAGGHSVPGFGTVDDGIVLDLGRLKGIRIDPGARTARVQPGCTWGDLDHATHAFGLATTGGVISTTGVSGLTLGGGIGYLARAHGLSCDNLIGADVVTADGSWVHADEEEHSDLFWALRGGGGNFGVVTELEFALHPVEMIYGGPMFFELEHAAEVLRTFGEWIADAPRAMGAFPAFQMAPPLPFVPPARHGDTFIILISCFNGPAHEGAGLLDAFRDIAEPVAEHVDVMPYPALNSAFDALVPPGLQHYWKASFVHDLTDEAIAAHVEHGARVPAMQSTMHLYPINGAVHDVGPEDTAFSYRDANFAPVVAGMWPDAADNDANTAWVRDYHRALAPHSAPGGYINFMADDDQDRVEANYGNNFSRLVEVKRQYDPHNLFHLNQNIVP